MAAHELFCKHCISQGQLILRELIEQVKGAVDWGLGQEQEGKVGAECGSDFEWQTKSLGFIS